MYAAGTRWLWVPVDVEFGYWVQAFLRGRHFTVTDRATEEVLVRSFVKHDGLMDKWNCRRDGPRVHRYSVLQPIRGVTRARARRLMG